MDFKFSIEQGDKFLIKLFDEFDVYGPKRFSGEGRYCDDDSIRYGKINSFSEVVLDRKSDYSAKEVILPVNHLYGVKINGELIKAEYKPEKKKLIIARACDINAMERLDRKFYKDDYYLERRKDVKFILLGCEKSFDSCACVGLGTNKTDNYAMAIKFFEDSIGIKIKDEEFNKFIDESYEKDNFEIDYVTENKVQVNKPVIEKWDTRTFLKLREMPFWDDYKKRCIGCGSCNASCPTCTCLSTKEVKSETSEVVEVRRIWNGCQLVKSASLKEYTLPEVVPARIRQRVLDKFYIPNVEEHGEQECVGCGRCSDICPRYINFFNTVNRLSEELGK
ncbi:MAG: 4Fe-4S dicluster domain-containing protein [Sarcina sp.]